MSHLDRLSQTFHDALRLERTWMEYRAEHSLYYPSDPRWKNLWHWKQHIEVRDNMMARKEPVWAKLTDLEQYVIDPHLEETGYDWVRNEYELKIRLRKEGGMLNHEWPDPWCRLIGHLRSSEEDSPRFVCMNCWKMYDRDPTDSSFIVGGPDERWIADVLNRYAKTRGPSKSASARRVSGRSLQPESSVENVQEETKVSDLPGSCEAGHKSR